MTRTRRLLLTALVAASAGVCVPPVGAWADGPAVPAGYTVKAGDSLVAIARRLGVRLSDLLDVNDLTITSVIHPGDSLTLPPGATAPTIAPPVAVSTASVPTTSYTVEKGDALSAIAVRHGVTLKALLTANKLQMTSTIMPGRVLQIPPATKPIPTPAVVATPAPAVATVASAATPTEILVDYLKAQIGKPYKFFTAGPETFDCSGLVVAGFRQLGIELIHQSGSLAKAGRAVDLATESIVAGDVIVLSSPTDPTVIAHVGVAISSTSWIQAVAVGIPVRIGPLPTSRVVAVRRVIGQ